jgi:NHLM bacteriocin system ABC transporter peptidase/ATP-binding protein
VPARRRNRVRTPTVLQMEALECGAAALGMILAYWGRWVALEELRVATGVSRDGSNAANVVKAARAYGLEAKGFREDPAGLRDLPLPLVVFWNFNHFVVVEGWGKNRVYLNDPASGPRHVTAKEFDESFTGIAMTFEPGPEFKKEGTRPSLTSALARRLEGSRTALTFVVLVSLLLVIPGLIIPAFSKIFVDEFLVKEMKDWIRPLLLAMGITAVLRAALTWIQQAYLLRLDTRLALSSASRFFWHVLRLPAEFFTQRYAGDIVGRVAANDRVAQLLSGDLATNMVNVVQVVFYAVIMLFYDVVLTLVGVGMAVINIIALRVVNRRREDANRRLLQDQGKLMAASMNGLQIIETLKAAGSESDFFQKWAGYQAKVINTQQELGVPNSIVRGFPPTLSAITTALILGIGGFRLMNGDLSVGTLIAFQTLMGSFMGPITGLVDLSGRLQQIKGDLTRLDDVLRYPQDPRFTAPAAAPDTKSAPAKLSGFVEVRGVTFGYSRLAPPLIEGFSLVLKPGSRVAIVGASGSGKSTLARLITGLYRPWSGQILFDGQLLDQVPREVLTSSLAAVDQDIFLFEGTVRDNLTLWDDSLPETQMTRATKDASIHPIIAGRSNGYGSLVAEGGANFSGGERQRLEIARALVGDPTILVMDEATASLDPITEKDIDDNLRRRGCTCVIIAHRLSTIRDADEIIVLDRGKVVQRGTHEKLIAEPGLYANLIATE